METASFVKRISTQGFRPSFLILLSLFALSLHLSANPSDRILESRIKNSDAYRWGEAENADQVKAKEAARRDLCQKIYVAVSASFDRTVTQTESDYRDTTVIATQTYSALNLQNLEELIFKEKDLFRVVAYIDTANLNRSFEESKRKVRDLVGLALQAESECRISDALKLLFRAFLLTHTFCGELDLALEGVQVKDARLAIERKMRQVTSSLQVEASPCVRTAGSTHTTLSFKYRGRPLQNLDFTYYCGDGNDPISVTNGEKAYISIFKELTQRNVPLPLRIEYLDLSEMRGDPEILNLYEILKDKCFDLMVEADLLAPWIPPDKPGPSQPEPKNPAAALPPPIPLDWSISIQVLADIADKSEFQKELTKLTEAGKLYTASELNQLSDRDRRYLALYCEQEVTALLFYDGSQYRDVRAGREYADYKVLLPAEGRISGTWIGEVQPQRGEVRR